MEEITKTNGNWLDPVAINKKAFKIYAEVVTYAAGSLEAGGLPGYPEVFLSLK